MKTLYVYADFDFLKEVEYVGELIYESVRGTDSYGFKFCKEWLHSHPDIVLSDDINLYQGIQYTQPGRDIFGCFADALPDRWGRTLLLRREQLVATEEQRPIRRLSSFDFLIGIDDYSRMGGFRFKECLDGDFINATKTLRIPPLAELRELIAASQEIERSEEANMLPDKHWIAQLVQPGSSLGGARPKASVAGDKGQLFIAKFPSRNDTYDVALLEHFSHLLARNTGINVAETCVIAPTKPYHTLLSQRFDRTNGGRRRHFASALTLLGLTDGDNAMTGHGYLDIVDFIIRACTNVEANLCELYRRIAFNICIGNSDDHFRNHGFILTAKGWTLSPAYDINPTTNEYQSLLVDRATSKADLAILLAAAEDYMLSRAIAEQIISEVVATVKEWRTIAKHLGISRNDMMLLDSIIDKRIKEIEA